MNFQVRHLIKLGKIVEPKLIERILTKISEESSEKNYTLEGLEVQSTILYSVILTDALEPVACCGVLKRPIFPENHYRFLNRLYTFEKFKNSKSPNYWCIRYLLNEHIQFFDSELLGFVSREKIEQTRFLRNLQKILNRKTGLDWILEDKIFRVSNGTRKPNYQKIVYFNKTRDHGIKLENISKSEYDLLKN